MAKNILITGAAKRIGREIALYFADMGYSIALHYKDSQSKASILKKEIESKGVKCKLFHCDFNKLDTLNDFVSKIIKAFGSIDVLINNASVYKENTFYETTLEVFENNFNVNFKIPFFLTKILFERKDSGHVINILDSRIARNDSKCCSYTLSKKALGEFTKMAAYTLAPNIRVNAIAPGIILPPEGKDDFYISELIEKVPMKCKGSISNILSAIEFLEKNESVTGEIIFMDGGLNL
ncbi:MAG: Short-chain dehydrogenase/reductase SDR [uncultured bacterium]|nr:MAG: Short-chain dehydrogenase/reductase SDR [uncultured bacterium]